MIKVILMALLLVPFATMAKDVPHDVLKIMFNSTVKIVSYNESKTGRGVGSGVILNKQGLIMTNYHVIHKANKLKVWLWKNRYGNYHPAKIIAIDPVADLALIDIDPIDDEEFTPTEMIEGTIYPGSEVVAVGHPLGMAWSVTKGVINQLDRQSFITPYVYLVQHDAVINEGNSGGPLFNTQGQLIGINTYMIAPKGKYSGMGYAVQLNSMVKSLNAMIEYGEVVRPAMKLNIINLSEEVSEYIKANDPEAYVPNTFGLIMNFLDEDGHAAKQGLKNLDVIVAVNGFPVNHMRDVGLIMDQFKAGETIYLTIIRRKKLELIEYVLGVLELPEDFYDKSGPGGGVAPSPEPETDKMKQPRKE